MAELLEKIPVELCWFITAKTLVRFAVLRGVKTVFPLLGEGEGVIAPILGWEKWKEIIEKVHSDNSKRLHKFTKETFNISVEDATGAAKLHIVAWQFQQGPEMEAKLVEAVPKRAVIRWTKCAWWERYEEFRVDPELRGGCHIHEGWSDEGLKEINQKLTYKLTKSLVRGDPYCEAVIEFKEA